MKSNTTKLQKTCDALMQKLGKIKYPKSLLSGLPTDVMHHYIPKSVSSMLRYDWDNLIPLTNGEHCRLHQSPDPTTNARILEIKGMDWFKELKRRSVMYHKVNVAMYEEVKARLESELK
jgi:hypothetical protein